MRKIASRISIQYTYLSKVMNREDVHLSEDHLYEICKILQLFPDEVEYLVALRGLATATSESRKDFLTKKILSIRNSKQLNANVERGSPVSGEINFLLSPLAWIAYFALGLQEFRENPRRIGALLSLEPTQVRSLLQNLHDLNLIEIGENIFDVKKVNKNHFHYSFDHPLTNLHQQMLRLLCDSHYLRLPQEKRHRFMATFSADPQALERIEKLFGDFIKEVEKVAVASPRKKVYQLNFELFPWT